MPTYWYVTALGHIGNITAFSSAALAPVWQAILLQLAFAAAIFCVSLVVSKHVNQSERGYGSVKTALED
jgi:prepilin signal peptidase PulO-like enzyme (type II secretory pathway)